MTGPSDVEAVVAKLSEAQRAILTSAIEDEYVGTWIGNVGEPPLLDLLQTGVCGVPKDGGGLWGFVSHLTPLGIECRRILERTTMKGDG
jgi:hypothetical protein